LVTRWRSSAFHAAAVGDQIIFDGKPVSPAGLVNQQRMASSLASTAGRKTLAIGAVNARINLLLEDGSCLSPTHHLPRRSPLMYYSAWVRATCSGSALNGKPVKLPCAAIPVQPPLL